MRIKSGYKENTPDINMDLCISKKKGNNTNNGISIYQIYFMFSNQEKFWNYPSEEDRDKELARIDELCGVITLGDKKPEAISSPEKNQDIINDGFGYPW